MERKEQEVAEEYLSSLADLNLNSKPLINMLTILAEENIEYASIIVRSVEQHIAKVNPDVKLPVLYLIDSIVKNVGREYIQLFSHCIVHIFCSVFEKVNEKIREKMYTLRQTWNDVFTPQKLYTLDVKVNCMDPNWPITAKVVPKSPAIHFNPNFLKNKSEPLNEMQSKLREKQRQLLELQKRKLELELAATKQRLEEQEKQLSMQTESIKVTNVPTTTSSPNQPHRGIFNPYKVTQQRNTNLMNVQQGFIQGNQALVKVRVAPVNPNMITTLRQRDPRLVRQQQQQMENAGMQSHQNHASPKNIEGEDTSRQSTQKSDKDDDENQEKFLKKSENVKGSYVNKEKVKSSYGDKRSQSKSNYEKCGNDKSLTASSSGSRNGSKSSKTGTRGNVTGSGSKSCEKDGKTSREKIISQEKKRITKTHSPLRSTAEKCSSKLTNKSPKRISELSKASSSTSFSTALKFKDIKHGVKSRNYIRRNKEGSKSPSLIQDTDFRSVVSQEKQVKLIDKSSSNLDIKQQENVLDATTSTELSASTVENKLSHLDKNREAVSRMDIDLRQFQTNTANIESNTGRIMLQLSESDGQGHVNKRSSSDNVGEPLSKKSKSDKIDGLFGTKDVDLRTINSGSVSNNSPTHINAMKPMTPPPPPIISSENENWTKVKESKKLKTSPTKSTLDDVRAKLAKASKGHLKIDREIRKQQSRIVDTYNDSNDGTDANIRTIISQAQELLDSENMNVDQYNTLVKTVIQINETNKLKEAQRRESLLTNPIEDQECSTKSEESRFSSPDDDNSKSKLAKDKPSHFLKKIPRLSKEPSNDAHSEMDSLSHRTTSVASSMLIETRQNLGNVGTKLEKRGWQRDNKWSSQCEIPHNTNVNQKPSWTSSNNQRSIFTSKIVQQPSLMNRMPIPSPWQNPPPMIFAASVPSIQLTNPTCNEVNTPSMPPSQFGNSVNNPKNDILRTINIDSVAKEIRIYDEIAVVLMDWDQPREIGFQNGQRRIIINEQEAFTLNFNDDYKPIMIAGAQHKIRFGCPSREIYIDDNWYECCFGGPPLAIPLDGKVHFIKIEGPPPQVNIGNLRQDLIAGKINLIVDARIIIPVFLDATVQTFELDGQRHTLQFADNLRTVLIDNETIQVEYGSLPKSLFLSGIKYFIRFGTLPHGIIPGKILIKNMRQTDLFKSSNGTNVLPVVESKSSAKKEIVQNLPSPIPSLPNSTVGNKVVNEKFQPSAAVHAENVAAMPSINTVNIDELFQKLLASGILNQSSSNLEQQNKNKDSNIMTPIDFSKQETLRIRQCGIIQKLFSGMQCSSCGVRFPPEQTMKYSQHLDWHFRQNRRERDSSRKAHSRKWYYDVSDWIQYEEIEDLDDREKNWFESQQSDADNIDETSNSKPSSPPPSCPAGPDDVDRCCDMCHDKFEQFYNEEFEEWHLKSAIRIDNKIYHPLCYQDHKISLEENQQTLLDTITDNAADLVIVKEEVHDQDETNNLSTMADDDDDVIVLPNEEPPVTEIPDDDEDLKVSIDEAIKNKKEDISGNYNKVDNAEDKDDSGNLIESDVEIQEPNIPFTDLDTYEEVPPGSVSTIDESSQSSQFNNIRIKEEPRDEEDDDDVFEDVGTYVTVDEISQGVEEYVPQLPNTIVSHDVVTTIDGNTEIQDTPTSVGITRIKINITKPSGPNQKTAVNILENQTIIPVICKNQESGNVENVITGSSSTVEIEMVEPEMNFTFKPELDNIDFKNMPKVKSGFETSGLCSIM